MEYKIIKINDNNKKTECTNTILRKLPEWFGIEESIQEYVNTVYKYPFWAAFDKDNCIGFFSGKIHYNRTGDIYVCGIDPEYHGKGIGTLLYKELENYFIRNACDYVIVKTLSEKNADTNYAKTRNFYKKIGFKELLTLTEMWDTNNPCLIMIKNLYPNNIAFKELKISDINNNMLDNFNRYQEVKKSYRKENGDWVLKDIGYIKNWDRKKLETIILYFSNTINKGGYVFGAYENEKLIGFAVLLNEKFGSRKQYIQLENLHISLGYRHKGIGKKLFRLCIEKAEKLGAEKIYISANSSEETQKFYVSIGCIDAAEINKKIADDEPYDRQMEYKT